MTTHPPLTPFGSALAGALGAVFSNAVVYPLDTVKTRLQALPSSTPVTSAEAGNTKSLPANILRRIRRNQLLTLLLRIIRTEGLSGAFKGFTANMINTFSMQFAYFFFHTSFRTRLITHLKSPHLSTSSELLIGALAGAAAQIFTIPVSVIATRQQLYIPNKGSQPSAGLISTAKEIISESGPSGLWTGLKPGLVLTVNPAITYGVFERLKTLVLAGKEGKGLQVQRLSVWENFWLGVGSKMLATVVTYPYIFAKVRLQARTHDLDTLPTSTSTSTSGTINPLDPNTTSFAEKASHPPSADAPVIATPNSASLSDPSSNIRSKSQPKSRGAIPLLMAVYRKKGFGGWYQGLGAQIVKAVLCQGILFVSKDQFEVYAAIILAFLARLRHRIALRSIALRQITAR